MPYTDFGARHYSPALRRCPALRRWLTPDPLSEKYYTSSPYAYCADNPINLVDPDGRRVDDYLFDKNLDYTGIIKTGANHRIVIETTVYPILNNRQPHPELDSKDDKQSIKAGIAHAKRFKYRKK